MLGGLCWARGGWVDPLFSILRTKRWEERIRFHLYISLPQKKLTSKRMVQWLVTSGAFWWQCQWGTCDSSADVFFLGLKILSCGNAHWISEDVTRPNELLYRKEFLAGFICIYLYIYIYISYIYIYSICWLMPREDRCISQMVRWWVEGEVWRVLLSLER